MAPCNKCTLLTIALAAVILQPSAASRAHARATAANADPGAAPSPAPEDDGAGDDGGGIPQLPPQPRECRPWLARMMPCSGFLTNSTVYAPEATCCDGFNAMFTLDTVTCLCHVVNGDVGQLLPAAPAPMLHMRMVELFLVCGHDVRVDILAAACNLMDGVPPIDIPSPPPLMPLPWPSSAPSPAARWP